METLQNLALFCCASLLCLTFVVVFGFMTIGRRLLRIDLGKRGSGIIPGISDIVGDLLGRR